MKVFDKLFSTFILFYLTLAITLIISRAEEDDIPVIEGQGPDIIIGEEEDVLVLTSDNFHYVVSTRDPILVEFYAPWCGHCKTLAPEYAKAAQKLKPDGIRIAKVDATIETELAKEFDVTGFPTLKLFRGGQPAEEYDGTRTAQGLIEFMKQKADPSYVPPPTAVVEVGSDTFEATVHTVPLALVEFYAPWCKHCQALVPEYESAAQSLSAYGILLAKVDATENKELAEKYQVTGYPTFKVFRQSRVYEYKGGREAAGIIAYMKEQQRLPSQEVRSRVNAKNAILRTQPTVFGTFTSDQDALFEEFIVAANELRGQLAFVHTFAPSLGASYGVGVGDIAVIMPEIYQSEYEDKLRVMPKEQSSSATLVSWVLSHSTPLLGERTPDNQGYLYTSRPLLVVYGEVDFSHQHLAATQHLRSKLLPLAARHAGSLTFALSSEDKFGPELQALGLEDSGEDTNAAIYMDKARYAMEPDDDFVDALEEFISSFQSGKVAPYVKSQPAPARQSGPVTVLVAKTFDKVIGTTDKHFLIEFYAPWCGHCKQLEPVYRQLAKHFSDSAVVVAKMDATANDVPSQYKVSGFPTIYFVRKDDPGNPVLFEGDRTLKKLKAFVKEQQTLQTAGKDEL